MRQQCFLNEVVRKPTALVQLAGEGRPLPLRSLVMIYGPNIEEVIGVSDGIAVHGDAFLEEPREQVVTEIVEGAGRNVFDDLRLQDEYPRIGQIGEDLRGGRLLREAGDPQVIIHFHEAAGRRIVPLVQGYGRQGPIPAVGTCQGCQIQIRQHIAVDHKKGVIKVALQLLDGPCGTQHGILWGIGYLHAKIVAIAEVVGDEFTLVMEVDGNLGYAVALEQLDDVFQQRLAPDGQHSFGAIQGQRPQSSSFTGCEDDRFDGCWPIQTRLRCFRKLVVPLASPCGS